jgi:hypothetical protein
MLFLFSTTAFAQAEKEDVIYLKNGSVYRGTITKQIPNVSYTIEIAGGSEIVININDVIKIDKEDKSISLSHIVRPKPPFHYKRKGYFFQSQMLAEVVEVGIRIVNGYKIGRFGYLGIGVGVDGLFIDNRWTSNYSSVYFPIYLYYGGDILKKRTTPFYTLEAGYAFRPSSNTFPIDIYNGQIIGGRGGWTGGVGFGARFYSKRVHFDLSANVDLKQTSANVVQDDNNGNPAYYFTIHTIIITPGLRFGIGF